MELTKILQKFGLSEKESLVYLSLLKLGVSYAREIVEDSGLNRSTIYVVLDSLLKKGLINIVSEATVQRYIATSPEILLIRAKEASNKYGLIKDSLQRSLPELRTAYRGAEHKPRVRVLEGKDGLIEAFEDTLKSKEKLVRISSSVGDIFQSLPEYLPFYVQKRYSRGIKMRGIHPDDYAIREMVRHHPDINFDEIAVIPLDKFKLPSDIAIYDNKVGLMSTKEMFAVIIESKEIVDLLKTVFDLAWEEAVRLQRK